MGIGAGAGGMGFGGIIILGFIVGLIAVRLTRFWPGPLGASLVGIVAMLIARFALSPFALGRGMALIASLAIALGLAVLILRLLRYAERHR